MDFASLFTKLQKLSKIKNNPNKTEKFQSEFQNILEFVRLLDEVPSGNLDKDLKHTNKLREDNVVRSGLDLKASTNISNNKGYIVPNVLGKVT